LTNVDSAVRRRDHLHFRNFTIDNLLWKIEFTNHAKRDSPTTRLAVIHFALDQISLATAFGEGLGGASTGWAPTDDSDT
jgi:hypothetical protein